MDNRHVKTINTDSRSKKRIRFASSKERSKKASADVYRSYKNRIGAGATSAATRESFVHNPREQVRKKKRHKMNHTQSSAGGKQNDRTALVQISKESEKESSLDEKELNLASEKSDDELQLEISTSFSSEVDVTIDRNASEIFAKFHREIWLLIRSLPEILHNLDKIVDILIAYMLSPISKPESPTPIDKPRSKNIREEFVINHATTDILHLLSVLARDLRHEIHPYLHTKILPRILNDLLNPPPPPPESKKQPIPLDVTIVETAFRTLSYIFRYDSNLIVNDMESMRKYYGVTLGHRRELVRRLSAETFAPHIRKIKSQSAREKHIRRVLRALASTTSQTVTKVLQRTQMDAVDGISNLLFQLVKGVPGKLHSQGGRSLNFILEYACREKTSKEGIDTEIEADLVYSVASGLLKKLFYHLNTSGFDAVCLELFALLSASIQKYMKASEDEKPDASFHPIKASLNMIVQVATVREGKFLRERSDVDLEGLCDSISKLCSGVFLDSLPQKSRCNLLSLLSQIWIPLQDKDFIYIEESVERALESQSTDVESVHSLSLIVARDLLPLLEDTTARTAIMSRLIASSARVTKSNHAASLEIIFAVASAKRPLSEDADSYGTGKSFELFNSGDGSNLGISQEDQNLLLDACLVELGKRESVSSCTHLGFSLRCAPFLATLSGDIEDKTYKKIVEWLSDILTKSSSGNSSNTNIVKGLAFEAFSSLTLKAAELSSHASFTKKSILRFKKFAGDLIKECCGSLWAIRGLASFIPVLERFGLGQIIDDTDEAFDLLMPNLRTANHFLRLNTLQILASFPEKFFVVDHADLDLTDDLDEEKGYQPSNENYKGGPVGPCDIIKVLLKLESSPIRLDNERQISGLIGKVEVLARTRRLPAVYAELAANHMLGVFNVKFAPIWRSAEKALLSLLVAHEEIVWPSFETKLVSVMKGNGTTPPLLTESDGASCLVSQERHFQACLRWEESGGRDVSLFETSLLVVDGDVPCYHITDAETVMESVWNVAEQGHRVVAKHSRGIVPLFLSFLHDQYFAFHSNDQGARELHLGEVVEKGSETWKVPGYILQKRLKCFLRTFSAVEGPKQLIKHQLLEKIFRSFLSHQDVTIAGYSVSCLLKFKLDYMTPYQKHLKEMMQKGKLRNSLLNLSEVVAEGKMNNKDRKMMLPILARILFGRVSAKSGKSSNDSPAARRAAVLSFMSVICKEEGDFFPFLYLMTRCFIPQTEELNIVESYEADDRSRILDTLMQTSSDYMTLLPGPVVEGFLHLLQSVLSQFGHHVISWIPQLTAITVELCNLVKVGNETQMSNSHGTNSDGEERKGNVDSIRRSSIRTLCFQRLCDIFSLFGSSLDFSSFADTMWSALQPSLVLLPEMVIRNDGCPAILTLLQTISADANLIKLLYSHDEAVHAVVKCISVTTRMSVIQISLTFIDNLLSVTDKDSVLVGKELVCKFAPLLLEQFTMRLEGKEEIEATASEGKFRSKLSLKNSPTWRRELQILFRICGLFSFEEWESETEDISFVETLCNLLVPFLEPNNGTLNDDKMNVVGILNEIVAKLQPEVALFVFWRLSSILAPHKSRVGIEMLPLRSSIAVLIDKAAARSPDFKVVSNIVVNLSSVHKTRVDEIDFETVIPELLSLAKLEKSEGTWGSIYANSGSNPSLLSPIINTCFHFLHNEDGVISRASFNALKALVVEASSRIHHANENAEAWIKMVESSLIPVSRLGLQSKDSKVRRYYILLIREVSREFSDIPSANLCGDLSTLCDDGNHDLDFFLGITHVQIHRRARAFQRLRKALSQIESDESKSKISSQSLSSVLLPIALHPIYECKMRSEEGFVLDAIATLGAIARYLPWNKYNNMLWLILSQFDRFIEQERYSVGALCAIIDGFNFELTKTNETGDGPSQIKTSVFTSLENRIIPKIEGLLSKETTDKNGNRGKTIRPAIILALVKLFQKFPEEFFDTKLHSILAVICDALRNKDSSARDVARNTLAKVVCSIDLKYLGDVIREVAITLNEGYKLHVRAATIHTILLKLMTIYEPSSSENGGAVPFDYCTAAIMDLLQDDLFGVANERRESQDTNVRFVKEAGGNKSVHSIEMLCRMITFAPSKASSTNQSRSAVHCVISPLLERLRLPDIDAKMIRKVKEVLSRIAIGISNNKSLKGSELFPFVYATIHPFIGSAAIATIQQDEDEDDNGDGINIKISGGKKSANSNKSTPVQSAASVVEWRPSTMDSSGSRKSAVAAKKNESHALKKVQDGASAPKLTGSSRHNLLETFDIRTINEPATITAIIFGLNLMNASLKKIDIRDEKSLIMLDPFVPMLTACVCHCRDTEVALIALKCLLSLLRSNLPSIPSCSKSIGSKTLTLLTSAGSSLSTNHDLTQACFKTLTHLIGTKVKAKVTTDVDEEHGIEGELPLSPDQMKVLISLIKASITDTDQHNPALNLIKVILMRRFLSPELYDLMESLMKLVVRSPKTLLRQECARLFVRYLLDYPMGEGRFEQHLKQIVANISYEYQEGRLSGMILLTLVVEKLPQELLQGNAQHIFLPLVLQLVNDDSKDCRAEVSKCIMLLLKRSSTELLQTFQDYCQRWSKQTGPLRLASLQVFGLLIDARADFIKSSSLDLPWIQHLEESLHGREELDWETTYFSLVCVEKLIPDFQSILIQQSKLMTAVTECLIDSHPWIKLSSSRVMNTFLTSNSVVELLSKNKGMLFQIVRNTLFQFNVPEDEHSQDLADLGAKTLAFALPLMAKHPQFCYAEEDSEDDEDNNRDPVFWLLRRVSQIAKTKGRKRRMTIFKCYAAFCSSNFQIVAPHLELILEGLHRSITEAKNEAENKEFSSKRSYSKFSESDDVADTEHGFAQEVLGLYEEACGDSSDFLNAYAEVKKRAYTKKQKRKTDEKIEAAQNPQLAAERRMAKQQNNKRRKKRRSDERRVDRGRGEKRYRNKY